MTLFHPRTALWAEEFTLLCHRHRTLGAKRPIATDAADLDLQKVVTPTMRASFVPLGEPPLSHPCPLYRYHIRSPSNWCSIRALT